MSGVKTVTAGVLLIGDELLSGRTRDINLSYIAKFLGELGIQVREARVIPDIDNVIVATLNEMRARFDYVFTTGGIGPTHDDITADAVARAFGVAIDYHPEALRLLQERYDSTDTEFTEARKRMARIPEGGTLIANAVSVAPGFRIGNVFVMAGVPMVMQSMMDAIAPTLQGGAKMLSRTVGAAMGEGQIAEKLGELQARHPDISIGSYPYYRGTVFGTNLVLRGTDSDLLDAAEAELMALIRSFGVEPVRVSPE